MVSKLTREKCVGKLSPPTKLTKSSIPFECLEHIIFKLPTSQRLYEW